MKILQCYGSPLSYLHTAQSPAEPSLPAESDRKGQSKRDAAQQNPPQTPTRLTRSRSEAFLGGGLTGADSPTLQRGTSTRRASTASAQENAADIGDAIQGKDGGQRSADASGSATTPSSADSPASPTTPLLHVTDADDYLRVIEEAKKRSAEKKHGRSRSQTTDNIQVSPPRPAHTRRQSEADLNKLQVPNKSKHNRLGRRSSMRSSGSTTPVRTPDLGVVAEESGWTLTLDPKKEKALTPSEETRFSQWTDYVNGGKSPTDAATSLGASVGADFKIFKETKADGKATFQLRLSYHNRVSGTIDMTNNNVVVTQIGGHS